MKRKEEEEMKRKEEEIKRKEKEEEIKTKKEEEMKRIKEEEIKRKKEEEIKRKEKEEKRKQQEELMKKKKEEERKKLDSFIPQFPNPVDFVQYIEIVRVNTKISGEMQNFLLQIQRKNNNNKYDISIIKNLPDISRKLSGEEIKFILSKKDFLIICTKKNCIFIYSMKTQRNINKIKNTQNKEINCLDISDDLQDLLCGYQDGNIAFMNIRTGEIKYITNKIHKDTSCLELKIYKKDKENEIYFISSGGDGQVFYSSFKKMIFWRLNTTLIIKNNIPIFMIKFINISSDILYYTSNLHLLKKNVIIGSAEEIKIFSIEPKIDKILEIKKPDYILSYMVPDAQVGIGKVPKIFMRFAKNDEKNHLLLMVSWGKIIYFYELSASKGNISEEYKEIGYYINIFDILRVGFLNSSIIYCLDKSYGIKILDTSKINQGKINISDGKQVIPEKNELSEIEKSRHICENIISQNILVDSNDNKIQTYLYSIIDNDCTIQILGEKEIYYYNLIKWDNYLKELQKKNDFLNLFSIGLDMYYGKISFFSDMPDYKYLKRKIGDFLKEIIPQYVNLTLKDKKSNIKEIKEQEKIFQCINIVIEVCLEMELVDFLIRKIEPLFEEKEYGELFLTRLEPFILCDKIVNFILSSDIILNLIDLYYTNEKIEILSQMLLHINIMAIDKPEIKTKLEELNLLIPLIYLYHNGKNEDYFAPLQKMFEYYKTKENWNKLLINEEDNLINYTNAITKKLISLKEIQNTKEYNGHMILWYIKWCLTGKKFPDNSIKMKDNLFDDLVLKIAYWLLNEKVINELLTFDPKNYFIIYKNLLTIKSLYSKLSLAFKNEKIKNLVLEELNTGEIKKKVISPISLVDYLVEFCKKINENKVYFYLYDFIIIISKNNDINIKKELRIESAKYILNNYKKVIKKINNQEVESLIKILKDFLKDKMFNEEDYKNILSSIIDNIFDELKLFLLEKMGNYKGYITLFLNSNNNIKNDKLDIYTWINQKLNNTKKDSQQYKELIEGIQDNCFSLINISLEEFYYLSRQIFQNLRKEVIDKLEKDKNIQLKYIELIIQSLIKKEYDFDQETDEIKKILILHIKTLCDLKKYDKIVPAFQLCSLYPFDECLSCCEKAKADEACIYLYIKEGSIEKGFELSISNLDDAFNRIVEDINNAKENKELFNTFNKYLLNARSICENNDKNMEDLWFKLLDILYKYENKATNLAKNNENDVQKKKLSDELYQKIIEDIKYLTEKMCSYVSIKRILEVVTNKNKISGFIEYKHLIMKLLAIYSNSSDILFSVKRLLNSLIFQSEHAFQNYNLKGDTLKDKCDKCNKQFRTDKIFIFNCKHIFHKECINIQLTELGREALCPFCMDINIENKNQEKSLVIKDKNLIDEKNQEKTLKNRVTQKLQRFDDNYLEKNKIIIKNSINL